MLASFTNHEMCNPFMQQYAYQHHKIIPKCS